MTGKQMTELQQLHLRWHNKTGEDMPIEIARQSLPVIRKAVAWRERGIIPVIPPACIEVAGESCDSLQDWDGHNNLN